MMKLFQDVFFDPDGAVCRSFFQTTDAGEKTWQDVLLMSESDDCTFWTVVANHKKLPFVLKNLIAAVDNAHSSVFGRQVRRSDEFSLITLLVRLATTTSVVLVSGVSVTDLSIRLGEIIPQTLLMPISLFMLRQCGPIASVTITSLCLLHPVYMSTMHNTVMSWCDGISRLAVRCVRELSRGRHQRLAGDVIPLFEEAYRHVKHLWALMHCAPFLADYMSLLRVLQYLRVVVDLLSPILQHFILTCSTITNRRGQLSKANSAIVNAAINTASVLVLFRTYNRTSNKDRCHCVDRLVFSTYDALISHITQKVSGLPTLLLCNTKLSLTALLHTLVPPRVEADDLEVGKVLHCLGEPVPDSRDFSEGFCGARARYFELLLFELVHQGFHIDLLLEKKFITTSEAEELGASERSIAQAIAGIIDEITENVSTRAQGSNNDTDAVSAAFVSPPVSSDPIVNMVLDVMPHFNVEGIKAALRYYNNDVEHFIIDASMNNIVPHLLTQLTETLPSASTGAVSVRTQGVGGSEVTSPICSKGVTTIHKLTSEDYDRELDEVDLNLFIGSDLYNTINAEEDGKEEFALGEVVSSSSAATGVFAYATHRIDDHYSSSEMFQVDEAMREKIQMLTELMYEDEYDDTQVAEEVYGYEACQEGECLDLSPSEDDVYCIKGTHKWPTEEGSPLINASHRPRTHYDEKKNHEARVKAREGAVKASQEAGAAAPTYTKKKKTVRKNNLRTNVLREVKKGKTDF